MLAGLVVVAALATLSFRMVVMDGAALRLLSLVILDFHLAVDSFVERAGASGKGDVVRRERRGLGGSVIGDAVYWCHAEQDWTVFGTGRVERVSLGSGRAQFDWELLS